MGSLGTIALSMVANTEGWVAGLSRGSKAVESFSKSTAAHLKAIPDLAGNLFSGMATAAVASATALAGLTAVQAHTIDKTGDLADRLGTTTAALSELQYAAKLTGSEAEDLAPALQKMNALLGDAARQGGPTADALAKLGLDARMLAQMDPTAAFSAIAGAFQKIPTAAEKASFAMDIFGKTGVTLLNTLSAGPDELARLSAEFRKFGGSVSEAERQGVGTMFDSLDRLWALLEGVGTQLAVQLAPFITAAANELLTMGTAGETMGVKVTGALESAALGVAQLADATQAFGKVFTFFFNGFGTLVDQASLAFLQMYRAVEAGLQGIGKWFGYVDKANKKVLDDLDKLIGRWERKIAKDGKMFNDVFGGPSLSDKVKEGFEKIRSGANGITSATGDAAKGIKTLGSEFIATAKGVKDFETSMTSQIATFGKSSHEAELYKLGLAGATEAQLANGHSLVKQLEGLNDAKAAFDATRTPAEKYAKELAKLNDLKMRGLIDDTTFSRAKGLADKGLEGDSATKRVGALEQGSTGAYSAILDYQGANSKDASMKDTATATKATAKNTEAVLKNGQQQLQALQAFGAKLTENFLQTFKI
jgi:hypothetical protein